MQNFAYMQYYGYAEVADDLQIYDHCLASNTPQLTNRLTHCIEIVGRCMDVEQPPEAESIEYGIHLAGFDASSCTLSGKMHLRYPITIGGETRGRP